MHLGDDDTVRLPRARAPVRLAPPRRASGRALPIAAGGIAAAIMLAAAAWLWLLPSGQPPATGSVVAPHAPEAVRFPLATEAEILANAAPELRIRRLADNPAILVLDFPTLAGQAQMLNRVAALVEKTGLPRDRVLTDAELAAAERANGGSAETFYYGHNYRGSDILRFFVLAERDGIRLNAAEEQLRLLARDAGWLHSADPGALVSIPHAGAEPWLDARARAAMLRHELSHGEFFTNPAYAALVWRFWREMLTEAERTRLRGMLAEAAYDPALEEVMANEAQAFLFHTPDERFFTAASIGFTPERLAALRATFLAGMSPGWLRDAMAR